MIVARLEQAIEGRGGVAIEHGGRAWTYEELNGRIDRIAGWLSKRSRPGDRVAALVSDPRLHVEGLLACARAGLVWAPVSLRLAPDARSAVLSSYEPVLVLADHDVAGVPAGIAVTFEEEWDTAHGDPPASRADPGEVVLLVNTGGTTGRAKAARLTHRGLLADAVAMVRVLGLRTHDAALHTISMWHLGGIWPLLCHLLVGGRNILTDGADPEAIVAAVRRHGVTGWNAVPVMIRRLLDAPGADAIGMLRWVAYGGAPAPADWIAEAFERWGPVMYHVYGLTEASPVVTCLRPDEHDRSRPERFASCGRPISGVAVRIADAGEEVPAGTVGEIQVRGEIVMDGYWRDPEATTAAMDGDWLRTGDLGVVDDEGYLRVVDRVKDVIITGGINVFAREVEDAICEIAAVSESAVVGYPDPHWGESIGAFVVCRPGREVAEEEIREHVSRRLARHARPRRIRFVAELPRTPIGKVDKNAIRQLPWGEGS